MKITKYLHSCLLIEEQGKQILIDPGQFTYQEKVLDSNKLEKLDYILITHEHFDHCYLPFIHELVQKFPGVKIISNPSVVALLQKEDLQASTTGNEFIEIENVPHEDTVISAPPANVLFRVFNQLTHPGDSHHFTLQTPILALPVQAPWGSMTDAIKLAIKLKPKVIIPIHDWHWKDEVREGMYKRLEEYFRQFGIEFKAAETGIGIEV